MPLVVGVTGHRDLLAAEQPLIKRRVREFFEALRQDYPDLPVLVMTALAEGADRIAAEVANDLGIPTIVLLPMPRDLYLHDFDDASKNEFHDLLGRASEVVELPLVPGSTAADVAHPGTPRDRQYAQLAAYLAAHSHILLAIWDGNASDAPGGTWHVVKFHQHVVIDLIAEGQHRSPIDFTEDESDLVFHVVCSRQRAGPATGLAPGDVFWFTRDRVTPRTVELPARYRLVFDRMAEFSTERDRPTDPATQYPLLPDAALASQSRGARDIDRLYRRADDLASHYQRLFLGALRITSTLTLLAGASFVLYADLPDMPFMIYPYIFCIALVLALAWLDRRYAWQRKALDYRVLAAGLRVQFYWRAAGVAMENPSRFSHDSFLKRQNLELGWIRNVLRFAGRRPTRIRTRRPRQTSRSSRNTGSAISRPTMRAKPQLACVTRA